MPIKFLKATPEFDSVETTEQYQNIQLQDIIHGNISMLTTKDPLSANFTEDAPFRETLYQYVTKAYEQNDGELAPVQTNSDEDGHSGEIMVSENSVISDNEFSVVSVKDEENGIEATTISENNELDDSYSKITKPARIHDSQYPKIIENAEKVFTKETSIADGSIMDRQDADTQTLEPEDFLYTTENFLLQDQETTESQPEIFPPLVKECTSRTCIRKCCSETQILRDLNYEMKCMDSVHWKNFWKVPDFKTKFGRPSEPLGPIEIIPGGPQCELFGYTDPDQEHHLLPNGDLFNVKLKEKYGRTEYCMEIIHENDGKKLMI